MTISTTGNRTATSGNGVTTAFSFPYYFALQTDLQVFVVTTATGASVTLTLSTDYTVTGAGVPSGGTVTAVVPPATGTNLVIVRTVSLLQATSWPNNTAFDGPTVEAAIDKLTIEAQQVSNALGRSPALGIADIDGSGIYQANGNKLTGLGAPVLATDAVRKSELDAAVISAAGFTPTAASITNVASGGVVSTNVQGAINEKANIASPTFTGDPKAPTAAQGDNDTSLATTAFVNTAVAISSGRKNRLKNAAFQVDQRGNAATSRANDVYGIDCWYTLTQTASVQVTQQTLQENGQPYNIRVTQNQAAAQRFGLAQIIEARDSQQDRTRAMVLSARVRISNSQAIRYAILEWTSTPDAVTSDVVQSWTSGTYTPNNFFLNSAIAVTAVGSITPAGNTWTPITALTGSVSVSANNLIVLFWTEATAAQSVTLDIGSVQLEPGPVVTTFEYRTIAQDYLDCQRYLPGFFCVNVTGRGTLGHGQGVSSTVALIHIPFKVATRIAPTALAVSGVGDFAFVGGTDIGTVCTAMSLTYAGEFAATLSCTVGAAITAAGQSTYLYGITAGTSRLLLTGADL